MPTHTARCEAVLKEAAFGLLQSEAEDADLMLGAAALLVGPYVNAGLVDEREAVRTLMIAAKGLGIEADEAGAIIERGFAKAPRSPGEGAGAAKVNAGRILHVVADWEDEPVPEREWLWDQWIPMGVTTVLYGDGGTGKSLLVQQLATAVAQGRPFLGAPVRRGPAIGLLCEDDVNELMRRQASIMAAAAREGSREGWAGLEDMRVMAAVGENNLLVQFDRQGMAQLTDWGEQWLALSQSLDPALIVIDTAADTFGGDENSRNQVRQFITVLNGLAQKTGAAVLLLAHPSVSGMLSGRGHSGSTAWPNGSRSHLYLQMAGEGEDMTLERRVEVDPDERLLTRRKSNYAAVGETLKLRWKGWAFEREAPAARPQLTRPEAMCLKALEEVTLQAEGGTISPGQGVLPGVTVGVTAVPFGEWSRRVLAMPLSTANGPGSRRAAFFRAKKGLKDKGLADFTSDWAWLPLRPFEPVDNVTSDRCAGEGSGPP
ncbi:MAG: RecA-family ATPase-like protein [Caulobacter sp.]|nr:RecA-family ATPase-like protein [Caulobacter sp.]